MIYQDLPSIFGASVALIVLITYIVCLSMTILFYDRIKNKVSLGLLIGICLAFIAKSSILTFSFINLLEGEVSNLYTPIYDIVVFSSLIALSIINRKRVSKEAIWMFLVFFSIYVVAGILKLGYLNTTFSGLSVIAVYFIVISTMFKDKKNETKK